MPHTHVHRPAYESPIHVRSNTLENGIRTPQCLTAAQTTAVNQMMGKATNGKLLP